MSTRWLAGTFDSGELSDPARLAGALAPHRATVLDQAPLRVAFTGPPSSLSAPLCLLDGFLDNAAEIADGLDLAPDTAPEVLLGLGWRRWGGGLLPRMRGEFALLLWDREQCEGLMARDQLGVRSIFLHGTGGRLSFATEIRHLLALLPQRPAPDPVSLAHWITMGHRPGPETLYASVRRLGPGSMLRLQRSGIREETYWAPRFVEPSTESTDQVVARTRAAMELAVRRKIAPDGITAVVMSGGLDSASVAAVASTVAPGQVSACSAVFPEHPAVDESALIEELRGSLHLGGATAEVGAGGLLSSALESLEAWGLPLLSWGDFWALPLLRAAAAEGVTVTMGGDGGDELFGARAHLLADRLRGGHPLQALQLARELPGAGDRPARRDVARMFADFGLLGALPYRLHDLARRSVRREEGPTWLRPAALRDLRSSEDPLAWKRMDGPRWWAEIAHGVTQGIEQIGVFEHQRRRAASAGLEARHPLFDLDLLELCLRNPPLSSFDRYRSRPTLRAAMSGLLPDSVRLRPQKALFDSVLVDCLTGRDGELVQGLLCAAGAELGAYIDRDGLEQTVFGTAVDAPRYSFRWMWQLWRLTTAECWLRAEADRGDELEALALQASPPRVALRSRAER
jgi:asparagine synthase (glutamine-hydrolysing)